MRRILSILCLPFLVSAEDWAVFRSGPFEVLTQAGDRRGREALNTLEQLRYALGVRLGEDDLRTVWPIRIVIFKSSRENQAYIAPLLKMGRDAWTGGVVEKGRLPLRDCVRILLEDNTARMPASIERGVESVFSTLEVDDTRIRLGAPPPAAERDRDWARMHLLLVDPKYSGRVRVLFSNLQQGADWFAAYKNAFEMKPEQVDTEVDRHLAAGSFEPAQMSGRPINPERDFRARDADVLAVRLALADLLEGEVARAAYQSIVSEQPEAGGALEGLGRFAEAVKTGAAGARCHVAYGHQEKDSAKARAAFQEAAKLNPRWGEPHFRMAEQESDPRLKASQLKMAAELEPRNAAYWQELGEVRLAAKEFEEASRAWLMAERASATEEERTRIRQARKAHEERRAELEAVERKRLAEDRASELQRLKDEALASIRAAEARANRDAPPADPGRKVVEWWDGPKASGKIQGIVQRVDCIRGQARLVVQAGDKKPIQVLIRDPSQVVILGGGEQSLGCGAQSPPRRAVIEYIEKRDSSLGTVGEATVIEFQ